MKIVDGVFYYNDKDGNEQHIEFGKVETNPEIYSNPKWHPQKEKIVVFYRVDDNCVFLYTENGKYEFKDFLSGQSIITKQEEK